MGPAGELGRQVANGIKSERYDYSLSLHDAG